MTLVNINDIIAHLEKNNMTEALEAVTQKFLAAKVDTLGEAAEVVEEKDLGENADGYMKGGNSIPRGENGATYHLGVKEGQIHPRILTVGSPQRARSLAKRFLTGAVEVESSRQMVTISGLYKGIPVSVCACLMGSPNYDMFFREAGAVLNSPLAIIRLGTCGINNPDVNPGKLMIASKGSVYAFRNYLHFDGAAVESQEVAAADPYLFSAPILPHEELTLLLEKNAAELVGEDDIFRGLNACGESFYSTQGRIDPLTEDKNEQVLSTFDKIGVDFIDMETHQMMHLAKCRKLPTYSAGCCIGLVNRKNPNNVVQAERLHELEFIAGEAIFNTLIEIRLPGEPEVLEVLEAEAPTRGENATKCCF